MQHSGYEHIWSHIRPGFYEDFEDISGIIFHNGSGLADGKVCFLIFTAQFLMHYTGETKTQNVHFEISSAMLDRSLEIYCVLWKVL